MIDIASTTNFSEANIFGGNSIADDLMYYGTEGKFVNLSDMMAQGYMPNFKAYLDANPGGSPDDPNGMLPNSWERIPT